MRREPIHTPDSPSPGQTAAQRTRPRRHQSRSANQWIRVQWELIFVTPIRIKYGIRKWGRCDCVTAHGLRTYCARTVSSCPRRRSPSVPVRMIRPGIRVVVGGTSTVSGSRRMIPNTQRRLRRCRQEGRTPSHRERERERDPGRAHPVTQRRRASIAAAAAD